MMRKHSKILSIALAAVTLAGIAPAVVYAAPPSPVATIAGPACVLFPRNLTMGMQGEDVRGLQQFLNSHGFAVAASGPGSAGAETTLFGARTRQALAGFQRVNGISPPAGYFGAISRAKVSVLCMGASVSGSGQGLTTTITPLPPAAKAGIGGANGVAFTPTVVTPPPSTVVTPPATAAAVPAGSIAPQSVVGVLCTYRWGNRTQLMKGSGVIVSSQGYVLTARHIVDPRWTYDVYQSTLNAEQRDMYMNAVLDHCEIGLPEQGTALPGGGDIRRLNPGTLITGHFQYRAEPYFLPGRNGLSASEYNTADFAVLKVSGPVPNCSSWNRECNLAGAFPYTPVMTTPLPAAASDEILSYGYPSTPGVNDAASNFMAFYLKGAVGTVGMYLSGDQRFAGMPMNFSFDAQDIHNGRSGSPIFHRGKVVGILYGSTSSQQSFNLSMPAIMAILKDAGLDSVASFSLSS